MPDVQQVEDAVAVYHGQRPFRAFGVEAVCVTTLQALSGAGYPGVPSLDAQGNVVPFIAGEEEKIAEEPGKILGRLEGGRVVPAEFPISVSVNRVPVRDGHTESVFVKLGRRAPLEEVRAALEGFAGEPQRLDLPSAPARPIVVRDERDRPQPAATSTRGAAWSSPWGASGPTRSTTYDSRSSSTTRSAERRARRS